MGVQVIPILSHPHSDFCVLFPFPWDSHGISIPIGNPILMHISTPYFYSAKEGYKGPLIHRNSHCAIRLATFHYVIPLGARG